MKQKVPYAFESEFVRSVISVYFDEFMFPLTKEELTKISIDYFKNYQRSFGKIDDTTFRLFWATQTTNYISAGGNTYHSQQEVPVDAKKIMKEIILQDLDEFLFRTVEVESLRNKSFTVSKTVVTIYNSWNKFLLVLNMQDEAKWKYLKEFKEFFILGLKSDFSEYVPFNFTIMPVDSKIQRT